MHAQTGGVDVAMGDPGDFGSGDGHLAQPAADEELAGSNLRPSERPEEGSDGQTGQEDQLPAARGGETHHIVYRITDGDWTPIGIVVRGPALNHSQLSTCSS